MCARSNCLFCSLYYNKPLFLGYPVLIVYNKRTYLVVSLNYRRKTSTATPRKSSQRKEEINFAILLFISSVIFFCKGRCSLLLDYVAGENIVYNSTQFDGKSLTVTRLIQLFLKKTWRISLFVIYALSTRPILKL